MYKKLYQAGIIAYSVLLVLAVLFYKERTIFLDNSLFLFEIIRNADFTIQRHRLISALPQVLPVLAVKAALSLKWVMILYSLSFALYHFMCYLLCGSMLKNYRMALVLLLTNTLLITHTFFWGLSELLTGMSLMLPFFALLITNEGRKINTVLLGILLLAGVILVSFSHPLIIIPFLFTAVFIWISKDIAVNKPLFITVNIAFILLYLFKAKFMTDAYESGLSYQLRQNIKTFFPDYLNLYSNTRFFQNCLRMYYWLPVSLIIISAVYIKQRKWLKLALVLAACIGYSQVINISFPHFDSPDFYKENMYMVLCVLLAFPLVYDAFLVLNKRLVYILFVLIISTGLFRIYNERSFYKGRLDWFRDYMHQHEGEKIMSSFNDNKPKNTMLMAWGSCYEFWLLSTVENNKTASIIIHDNISEVGWAMERRNAFVTVWGVFDYKELNPRYFMFTDTTSHYIFIK